MFPGVVSSQKPFLQQEQADLMPLLPLGGEVRPDRVRSSEGVGVLHENKESFFFVVVVLGVISRR